MKIFIDPGHGGNDPGAVNEPLDLMEKNVNLDVSLRLRNILRRRGYEILMSRDSDKFVSLEERARMANNWGADYFISVHCNSSGNPSANGTECYHYTNAGNKSIELAESVQNQMVIAVKLNDRGVKGANYAVLRLTNMPGILDELAFISNPNEGFLLSLSDFRQTCAQAIADGLQVFINS